MALIIAATDYTETGRNAVDYACKLASAQKVRLIIIHSYSVPVMFSDVPMPASLLDDTQHDSEDQMKKLVISMLRSYPELEIEGKVIYGDIVDAIEEYSRQHQTPRMIVIGNNAINESHSWPDSTLIEAIKDLPYPVLAVPGNAVYHTVQKICFAYDNKHSANDVALHQITYICKLFGAELHVVHALPELPSPDINPHVDPLAEKLMAPANPVYHQVFDNNVDRGIQTFIEKNNMDLLVVIPHKYTFFQGLFHKGHTKAIVHHTHIPILALHDARPISE